MKKDRKVVDLSRVRYAKTVMHFYDKFERKAQQGQREQKAAVEREARKKF